eukprot:scaffold289912_cov28-Tisochrysis_lutea.AAC.1
MARCTPALAEASAANAPSERSRRRARSHSKTSSSRSRSRRISACSVAARCTIFWVMPIAASVCASACEEVCWVCFSSAISLTMASRSRSKLATCARNCASRRLASPASRSL